MSPPPPVTAAAPPLIGRGACRELAIGWDKIARRTTRVFQPTRRDVMTRAAAGVAGLAALGLPDSLWALQDGEELVTLHRLHRRLQNRGLGQSRRECAAWTCASSRSWTTPNDEHYSLRADLRARRSIPPPIACASAASSTRPMELTLDQLKARRDRRDEGGHARVLGQLHPAAADVGPALERRVDRRRAEVDARGVRRQARGPRGAVPRPRHREREEVPGRQSRVPGARTAAPSTCSTPCIPTRCWRSR